MRKRWRIKGKMSKLELSVAIISWVIAIVIVGATLLISKFLFELVISLNIPDWLKYILLK